MLEQLKVKFCEGSDEGSESENEDPYKPFNIMKQKRYSRPSKIKHFSKLSNELPHFKDVNVSKKHEYSERKSQITFGDLRQANVLKTQANNAEYLNTEESVTENGQNFKEQLFYFKNENTALKINIENLQNKLVELQEGNDDSVKCQHCAKLFRESLESDTLKEYRQDQWSVSSQSHLKSEITSLKSTIISLNTTKDELTHTIETLMNELQNAQLFIEKQNRQHNQKEELSSKVIASKEDHIQNLLKAKAKDKEIFKIKLHKELEKLSQAHSEEIDKLK